MGGGTGVSAPDPKLILPMGDLVPGAWGAASPLQREQHPVSLGTQKTAITLQRGFLQTWDFSTVTLPQPRWKSQPNLPAVNELQVLFPI